MRKENPMNPNVREHPGRITRSRATSMLGSQQIPTQKAVTQQSKKRALLGNPKRASVEVENDINSDNPGLQRLKKRVVLQNVTNVFCDNSYGNCFNASKIQAKCSKPAYKSQAKVTPSVVVVFPSATIGLKEKSMYETAKANLRLEQVVPSVSFSESLPNWLTSAKGCDKHEIEFGSQSSEMTSLLLSPSMRVIEAENTYKNTFTSRNPDVVDVDCHKEPQLCCIYAPEIYENLRAEELSRRPSTSQMP